MPIPVHHHSPRLSSRYAVIVGLALMTMVAASYWAIGSGDHGTADLEPERIAADSASSFSTRKPPSQLRSGLNEANDAPDKGAGDGVRGDIGASSKSLHHSSRSSSSSSSATAAARQSSEATTPTTLLQGIRVTGEVKNAPPPVTVLGAGGFTSQDEWETAPSTVGPQDGCSWSVERLPANASIRRDHRPIFISREGSACPTANQMDAGACIMRVGGSSPAVGCLPSLVVIGQFRLFTPSFSSNDRAVAVGGWGAIA